MLRAYELVPEAYRQQFRTDRVQPGQIYLNFARQQDTAFDKWLRASKVHDFKELRELMVLEQFKQSLPKVMQTYLNDLDVKSVAKAAEDADNYVLIHKDSWPDKPSNQARRIRDFEKHYNDKSSGGWRPSVNSQNGGRQHKSPFQGAKSSLFSGEIFCHYCRKPGHIKSRCPALQRKDLSKPEACRSVVCNLISSNPVPGQVETVDKADLEMFDGFLSDGMVAAEEGIDETPVMVLRDTASGQSLVVEGTVDLPETAALGIFVPVKGFGGGCSAIPLYRICSCGSGA